MAVRMIVRVAAPTSHPDQITVQDAFAHVLELFDLAEQSESDPDHLVGWRLISATMQSPLTVTAEAFSHRPNVNVDAIAIAQREEFTRNYEGLKKGRVPSVWQSGGARKKAQSIVSRSRGGIGSTAIFADKITDPALVEFYESDADVAIGAMTVAANDVALKPKEQIGSIEGRLLSVGTHYSQPAILVRERKTNADVWCIVPDEFRSQIANEANFSDVWSGRRVRVRGRISYDRGGDISRILASEIHRIEPVPLGVEKIQDANFTGGLSVAEYLEKLREGQLD